MCIYSLDHIHIYIQYIPVPIDMSAVYCYGQILTRVHHHGQVMTVGMRFIVFNIIIINSD